MKILENLERLAADARQVLRQYEEAERDARSQLDQIVQGRLMQAGAIRGVEMAIQAVASAVSGSPSAADLAEGSGVDGADQFES